MSGIEKILDEDGVIKLVALIKADTPSTYAGSSTAGGPATSVSLVQATTNADRYVWFSNSGDNNKPVYDAAFKYNPATDNLTVGKINGTAVSSFVQESDLSAHEKNNPRNIEFIKTTNTEASSALTGVSQDSELYDGKTIFLYLSYAASTDATLNLTLANGTTTGEKPIYYTGTTRMTTHYGAGSVVSLTYVASEDSWRRADYNTNTTYSAGTAAILTAGTNTTNRVWSAKILHDYINSISPQSISNSEIDSIINGGE